MCGREAPTEIAGGGGIGDALGAQGVEKVDISDLHIQIGPNQDTAVASYILHVKTKLKDGKITDEDNQESDVLFKRGSEWKIIFLHYSAAPKK